MFPGTLLIIVSSPFFISPRAPYNHWNNFGFRMPHSLVFYFKIFVLWQIFYHFNLMDVFLSDGVDIPITVQVLSLLFLTMSGWLAEYSICIILLTVLPEDLPKKVSCHLVVPMDKFCLGKFRESRHKVFYGFFIAITESAMWVCTIFFDVMVV